MVTSSPASETDQSVSVFAGGVYEAIVTHVVPSVVVACPVNDLTGSVVPDARTVSVDVMSTKVPVPVNSFVPVPEIADAVPPGPVDPVLPVGPVPPIPVGPVTTLEAPVAPVPPVGPVAPVLVVDPGAPVGPVGPVLPVAPVGPVLPATPLARGGDGYVEAANEFLPPGLADMTQDPLLFSPSTGDHV